MTDEPTFKVNPARTQAVVDQILAHLRDRRAQQERDTLKPGKSGEGASP